MQSHEIMDISRKIQSLNVGMISVKKKGLKLMDGHKMEVKANNGVYSSLLFIAINTFQHLEYINLYRSHF